jgi:hypothetical protein
MYSEVDLAGTHLDRLNQASAIGRGVDIVRTSS